jgi:hypothetical protein
MKSYGSYSLSNSQEVVQNIFIIGPAIAFHVSALPAIGNNNILLNDTHYISLERVRLIIAVEKSLIEYAFLTNFFPFNWSLS